MQAMLVTVVPAAHRSQAQAIAEIAHQLSNFSASVAAGVVVNDSGWRGVALGTVFPVAVGALATLAALRVEAQRCCWRGGERGAQGGDQYRVVGQTDKAEAHY